MKRHKSDSVLSVRCIKTLIGHKGAIYSLTRSNKEGHFISAGGDGWIAEWNANDENGKLLASTEAKIFSIFCSKEGNLIGAGDMEGKIYKIDTKQEVEPRVLDYYKRGIFCLSDFNGDLISLSGDGFITRWDKSNFQRIESLQLSRQSLRGCVVLKNKGLIAIGSSDHNIYLVKGENFQLLNFVKKAHSSSVFSLAVSQEEDIILSGGRDAMLRIWGFEEEFNLIKAIPAHLFTINDIKYSPDFRIFATASRDKTIKLWDSESFELLKVLDTVRDGGHLNSVNCLLWLSNQILVSCSDDRSIKIWEIN